MTASRAWHLLTACVAGFAVVLQFVLVWQGHAVLDETNPPALGTRVVRFCSYLTIWFNVLVCVTTAALALDPARDGRVFRALRLDGVVLALGGGVVHWFLLRPLLDLDGADLLADKLLHVAVPLLVVVGWLAFGPRGRAKRRDVLPFLVVPVVWLVYTLVRGAVVGWYPYPFLDAHELGYAVALASCAGVTMLMLALVAGAVWLDGRLATTRTAADASV
jgi:hypothetical protein